MGVCFNVDRDNFSSEDDRFGFKSVSKDDANRKRSGLIETATLGKPIGSVNMKSYRVFKLKV